MNRIEYLQQHTRNDPEKYCEYCGKPMYRTRFLSGRLEDYSAFLRRKYCDRMCMRKAFVKKGDPCQDYSSAHHSAREIKYLIEGSEKICEICGSTKNIDVHHKDGNFSNNDPENLMLLCRSCHMKEHRKRPLCKVCGKPADGGYGYCNKHYLRYRKYGNPRMYYHKIVEK